MFSACCKVPFPYRVFVKYRISSGEDLVDLWVLDSVDVRGVVSHEISDENPWIQLV